MWWFMPRFRLFAIVVLGLWSACSVGAELPAASGVAAEQGFVRHVLPVLQEKCLACHGHDPDDLKGAYSVATREALLKGGESGDAAVVPGDAAASPLYQAIRWEGLEMPPKENDRLKEEQIGHIRDWINAGAPWPNAERIAEITRAGWDEPNPGSVRVQTSGGLKSDWTDRAYDPANLWAYQPLWRDASGRLAQSGRNPIDVLIEDRLREIGVDPAPPADRRTLLRRVTFDLTGLPPTPEEYSAFLADPTDDAAAFAAVVDRLLASPHYGEQSARHWLDVVRYADSSGFANDYERGNAWRYRDYVVRAFNTDKPYDEFVVEQIAGDELVEESRAESPESRADGSESELLVATGFLRMGPWELTGMEVAKIARQRFLDDVTDAVGQVFLAHMLQCARCHDHKFDPVPTRDYYSLQAAFATTQLAERAAPFLPEENTQGFDERKYLEQRQAYYQRMLQEVDAKNTIEAALAWYDTEGKDAAVFREALAALQMSNTAKQVTLDEVRKKLQADKVDPDFIPPRHVGFEPQDYGLERIARKGQERLMWRLERYDPFALSVYSGRTPNQKAVLAPQRMPANRLKQGELEQTCILVGGDPFSPSEPVAPGVLSAVAAFASISTLDTRHSALNTQFAGRRLALARWIASPDNPLTARVMVNRVWQWHFGQPLAGNPNNFGATGKKPTHPVLLDWLAGEFVRQRWSIKSLHRLILTSDAYRRSSRHPQPAVAAEKDPLGTSYAVFQLRRLDAEELRDAMLAVSGELNPMLGGVPVRPEMNREAAFQPRQVMGTFAEAWQPSPLPEQRHRRSLYALKLRGQRDPFYEVFNAPSPDLCTEAREASTVTPQVFALFNSESTFGRALALATRVQRESAGDRLAALRRAFELAYARTPSAAESQACLDHWQAMEARHQQLNFADEPAPTDVVREAVEENTGEKFTFREPLEAAADFVPDLRPGDVTAEVRGLAEVCLVLLNANEFAYLD
jgi:mono/diheme cytochrome c family protein